MTRSGAPPAATIDVQHLSKSFGAFRAVDDLSFTVNPGRITGFLGPNGAGKTTTLRMLLGLIRPTAGTALIGGQSYHDLADPVRTVGAALEATNFHPGRSGRDHLRVIAAAAGVPDTRVDELLEMVGIPAAARRRAGAYSMGMRQRLGLAAALLGDPQVVILDEPANGLDPEGIRWLREFLRYLASQGKSILISSHLLSEVQQTVDDVVIIANGRKLRQGSLDELEGEPKVLVRTRDDDARRELASALLLAGLQATPQDGDALIVAAHDPRVIGDVALRAGQPVYELRTQRTDLESLFLQLTESGEHRNRNLGVDGDAPAGMPGTSPTGPDGSAASPESRPGGSTLATNPGSLNNVDQEHRS